MLKVSSGYKLLPDLRMQGPYNEGGCSANLERYILSGKADLHHIFPESITFLDHCTDIIGRGRLRVIGASIFYVPKEHKKCKLEPTHPLKLYYAKLRDGGFGIKTLQTLCHKGSSGRSYQYYSSKCSFGPGLAELKTQERTASYITVPKFRRNETWDLHGSDIL